MRRAELVMAIAMAIFSAYLMWKSAELPIGWIPDEGPGGGAFPFWLSFGMLVCSMWTILRWFRRITPESRSTELYMSKSAVSMVGTAAAALLALLIGIHYIGIYFSLILFLLFFIRVMAFEAFIKFGV